MKNKGFRLFIFVCLIIVSQPSICQEHDMTTQVVGLLPIEDVDSLLNASQTTMVYNMLTDAIINQYGKQHFDERQMESILSVQDAINKKMTRSEYIQYLGKKTGDAYLLAPHISKNKDNIIVTCKLIETKHSHAEQVDYFFYTESNGESQNNCFEMVDRLLGQSIYFSKEMKAYHTNYYFEGNKLSNRYYENYLQTNCSTAYKQYCIGKKMTTSGWCLLGVGVACFVASPILLNMTQDQLVYFNEDGSGYYRGPENFELIQNLGYACMGIGAACLTTTLVTLPIGYKYRYTKSIDTLNDNINVSKHKMSINIISNNDGIGIAMNL